EVNTFQIMKIFEGEILMSSYVFDLLFKSSDMINYVYINTIVDNKILDNYMKNHKVYITIHYIILCFSGLLDIENFENLKRLALSYIYLSFRDFDIFNKIKNITNLELKDITFETIRKFKENIIKLQNLRYFSIFNSINDMDVIMFIIENLKNLIYFKIVSSNLIFFDKELEEKIFKECMKYENLNLLEIRDSVSGNYKSININVKCLFRQGYMILKNDVKKFENELSKENRIKFLVSNLYFSEEAIERVGNNDRIYLCHENELVNDIKIEFVQQTTNFTKNSTIPNISRSSSLQVEDGDNLPTYEEAVAETPNSRRRVHNMNIVLLKESIGVEMKKILFNENLNRIINFLDSHRMK
ncbi:9365_t:CDS:2, partial [Scutellospora calospora]